MAYIRRYYAVPAKRGMRVAVDGRTGVIVGARYAYLRVRFDDDHSVGVAHPTWRVTYQDQQDQIPVKSKTPVRKPRGMCPYCKESRALRPDGTLGWHKGKQRGPNGRLPCSGNYRPPGLPKSVGLGKDGPEDLSEREGFGE
jgi:hypothetical protein